MLNISQPYNNVIGAYMNDEIPLSEADIIPIEIISGSDVFQHASRNQNLFHIGEM